MVSLALILHAHQPVGNFDHVIEEAYQRCYRPFLEVLARYDRVRMGLHFSGYLFEWLEQHHPDYLKQLKGLVERGQVELLGGGFYEPILAVLPEEDRQAQLRLMADYLEEKFGERPRGIWLGERVWEPDLPRTLAAAGVGYTVVDDVHFLAAGVEPEELDGFYLSEDLGASVKVLPSSKHLRYAIPFRQVTETIEHLRLISRQRPGALITMGDDTEKFGVWPHTHEHVYTSGWLEEFFNALAFNQHWLKTVRPSDYLDAHPPRGRVYLPTISYNEMTEWALPAAAQLRYTAARKAAERRGDESALQFLRGGFWRSFFARYSESNFLHKRMLYTSARVRAAVGNRKGAVGDAERNLLRAQANDAYWHGIFSGLYAPHLRTAVYGALLAAERALDSQGKKAAAPALERLDVDVDGHEELAVRARDFALWLDPDDGGTVTAIDLLSNCVTLVNSLQRRPEAYHEKLREAARGGDAGSVASIHDRVVSKEPGLEQLLIYDPYERKPFRLLLFERDKRLEDFARWQLGENAALAGANYTVLAADEEEASFAATAEVAAGVVVRARKSFSWKGTRGRGVEIECELELENTGARAWSGVAGLEMIFNLLAPEAHDRWIEAAGARHALRWRGEVAAEKKIVLVDEWQKVRIELSVPKATRWWVVPIETVSQSEAGFEKVYQGSSLLPLWDVELAAGARWTAQLTLRAEPLK